MADAKNNTGETDTVTRFGEKFIILMPRTSWKKDIY